MACIYKITNTLNHKIYIGKTNLTIEERFKQHIKNSKLESNKNRPLYNAIKKYGIENFIIEKIEDCSEQDSSKREQHYIKCYNSYNNGYNATLGGEGTKNINYDLVYQTYLQEKNVEKTAQLVGCCRHSVGKILLNYSINPNKEKYNARKKPVNMIDKNTKEILQTFESISAANIFLGKNRKSGMINEVCQGKRKTAYGFEWSYANI
jgi:group I intron endonuclease